MLNSFVTNDSYFEFEKVPADSQGVQFSVQHSYGASRFLVLYLLKPKANDMISYGIILAEEGRQSKEQGAPPPPSKTTKKPIVVCRSY